MGDGNQGLDAGGFKKSRVISEDGQAVKLAQADGS